MLGFFLLLFPLLPRKLLEHGVHWVKICSSSSSFSPSPSSMPRVQKKKTLSCIPQRMCKKIIRVRMLLRRNVVKLHASWQSSTHRHCNQRRGKGEAERSAAAERGSLLQEISRFFFFICMLCMLMLEEKTPRVEGRHYKMYYVRCKWDIPDFYLCACVCVFLYECVGCACWAAAHSWYLMAKFFVNHEWQLFFLSLFFLSGEAQRKERSEKMLWGN